MKIINFQGIKRLVQNIKDNFVGLFAQELTDEQKTQVKSNLGILSNYEVYKNSGGTVSEKAYYVIQKYLVTPFLINASGTTIHDELLNDNQDNFITDYYWNIMRLTGGELIKTTKWTDDGKPNQFIGIVSGNTYTIDFTNKQITLNG